MKITFLKGKQMSNVLTIIAVSNQSHWPAEGSHKKYSAQLVPISPYWLETIHFRRKGYIERLEDLYAHHVPWFKNLDLATRYARLLHENTEELPALSTFPIISILGTHARYTGVVYIDENESMVDDDYYKFGNLLRNTCHDDL